MDPQQENQELKARLHAFAAILKLGRDALAAADLIAAGVHIVNNSYVAVCLGKEAEFASVVN